MSLKHLRKNHQLKMKLGVDLKTQQQNIGQVTFITLIN